MVWEPSTSATLLLIRHARTIWNAEERYAGHREVPLAPEAEPQIRHLTHLLVEQPISAIYSSPLSRCLLTVGPTAEILNLQVTVDKRLIERDLGAWEGQPAALLRDEYPGFHFPDGAYTGDFTIPQAESLDAVATRAGAALMEIAGRHLGQTVLIATHAGIIWACENRLARNRSGRAAWPENSTLTSFRCTTESVEVL